MPQLIDLTGRKFGQWTVKSRAESKKGNVYWNCICSCGTQKVVQGGTLKNGDSISCGCAFAAVVRRPSRKGYSFR